jgi:hypothetical protein
MTFLVHRNERREIRRKVTLACRVIRERDCELIGACALDLSPDGMLVMAVRDASPGDHVIVSFHATELGIRFDAEARVARVVRGRRPGDRGRCVGLRFEKMDAVKRFILRSHLKKSAPPLPQREPRIDYAATVRKIAFV